MQFDYEILNTITREEKTYTVVRVKGTTFFIPEDEFNSLLKVSDEHWEKVIHWVETELMPYMTLVRINCKTSSYKLKHLCEEDIGEYVDNNEIKYVLASKGVPSANGSHNGDFTYPNYHYPLSKSFLSDRANKDKK